MIFGSMPRQQVSLLGNGPLANLNGSKLMGEVMPPPSLDNIAGAMPGRGAPVPRGIMGTPVPPPVPAQTPPLGGSMRAPFDYNAVRAQLLPEQKKPSTLKKIATLLAPALMAASGNGAGANAFIQAMAMRRASDDDYRRQVMLKLVGMQHDDWSRQNEADLRAANPFSSGRDRVAYNPATGQSQVIYDGQEDFETYAGQLGLQPGTDDYFKAVEDYVLRSSGPTAHDRDLALEDERFGNRQVLEGLRQQNRLGLEGVKQGNRTTLRQTPTYRDRHGPPPRRSGNVAPTATGPNGQKISWNGKAWVDQQGRPVR